MACCYYFFLLSAFDILVEREVSGSILMLELLAFPLFLNSLSMLPHSDFF